MDETTVHIRLSNVEIIDPAQSYIKGQPKMLGMRVKHNKRILNFDVSLYISSIACRSHNRTYNKHKVKEFFFLSMEFSPKIDPFLGNM